MSNFGSGGVAETGLATEVPRVFPLAALASSAGGTCGGLWQRNLYRDSEIDI